MDSSYQTTRYNASKDYYDVLQAANTVTLDKKPWTGSASI